MSKIRGIMSTTHVDKHNEKVNREGLLKAAEQINQSEITMWINWNHQSTLPPIGKVEKAWVEQLEDGEFGLYFEGELFEENGKYTIIEDFIINPEETNQLDLGISALGISHDPRNFHDEDINQLIKELGNEFPIENRKYLRKSEVPQSVVWITVAFIGTGIATGILNRIGEKIADSVIKVAKPKLSKIGKTLSGLKGKTIQGDQPDYIFLLQIPGIKENIEGALESPSPEVLQEACEKLPELCVYVYKILAQNQANYFQDLKFLFNPNTLQWEINYLTIKKTQRIVYGKRYYQPKHPLKLRYEQELLDLKREKK